MEKVIKTMKAMAMTPIRTIRYAKRVLFPVIGIVLLQAPAALAGPSTEEVVAKAREYLGGDDALDNVRSILYRGTFESDEDIEGEIEIIFQKPLFQKVTTYVDGMEEVTALSYYDGWRRITERDDDSRWTLIFLEAAQIRELQANTWENLHFFKNIERRRGRIENHGLVEFEGETAVKLTFHHPGNIYFDRYFDPDTGKLRMTRASTGGEIREEGESVVDGIRFPESITMTQDGEFRNRIRFEEIEVNREFDEEIFDVPSMAPDAAGRLPHTPDDDLLDLTPPTTQP